MGKKYNRDFFLSTEYLIKGKQLDEQPALGRIEAGTSCRYSQIFRMKGNIPFYPGYRSLPNILQ